jgi:Tfp pilus assembly protein PilF
MSVALVAAGTSGQTAPTGEAAVEWFASYAEGSAAAAASGKPLLVYIWTSGRDLGQVAEDARSGSEAPGPRLHAFRTAPSSFWTPEVVELTRKFVCVKVDQKTDRLTARRFERLPPVLVFADSWGHEIGAYRGGDFPSAVASLYESPFFQPEDVVPLMQAIPTDFSSLRDAATALDADPKNAPALVAYGEFLRTAGLNRASNEYFKQALETEAVATNAASKESIELAVGLNYLKSGDYVAASDQFDHVLKDTANAQHADVAMLGLLTAKLGLGERASAESLYRVLKNKYPDSAATKQAGANLKAYSTAR